MIGALRLGGGGADLLAVGLGGGEMADETPLDVMQQVMRELLSKKDWGGALAAARAAAPYVHGKVPAAWVGGDLAEVPDDELGKCEGGGAGAAPADQG